MAVNRLNILIVLSCLPGPSVSGPNSGLVKIRHDSLCPKREEGPTRLDFFLVSTSSPHLCNFLLSQRRTKLIVWLASRLKILARPTSSNPVLAQVDIRTDAGWVTLPLLSDVAAPCLAKKLAKHRYQSPETGQRKIFRQFRLCT